MPPAALITKLTLTPAVSVIVAVLLAVAVMLLLVGPIAAAATPVLRNTVEDVLKARVMLSVGAGDGCRWSVC